jgi:predicted nucleic acid-binding protein
MMVRSKPVTSELTLAERLVKPIMDDDLSRQNTFQSFLAEGSNLQVIAISRPLLIRAAQRRATYKPRLPDAIHLATALDSGRKSFLTNDQLVKPIPGITILQLADFDSST